MILSTKDIIARDPVTGDTVWDEPRAISAEQQIVSDAIARMSPYDALDFLRTLSIEIEKRAADLRDQIQRTDR